MTSTLHKDAVKRKGRFTLSELLQAADRIGCPPVPVPSRFHFAYA